MQPRRCWRRSTTRSWICPSRAGEALTGRAPGLTGRRWAKPAPAVPG